MIYDEVALNNGVIFQRTVDILNEKMRQGISNMTRGSKGEDGKAELDASLFVSVSVNSAFACELYMKSMLPPNTRGHELNDLFPLLDADIQERIKNRTILEMEKIHANYKDTDFQNDLAQNSNVFAEWRYFHEGKSHSANIEFVLRFMRAALETANEERLKDK